MTYIIRDREAGNLIETTKTRDEAEAILAEYEKTDREEGTYTPDFYEIVDTDLNPDLVKLYDLPTGFKTADGRNIHLGDELTDFDGSVYRIEGFGSETVRVRELLIDEDGNTEPADHQILLTPGEAAKLK